jgi:heme A synthase
MSIAVGTPVNEAFKTIALVIVGVTAISALIGWAMWRSGQHAERVAAIGTALVLVGAQPKESLFGLPIALLLIWFFFLFSTKSQSSPKMNRVTTHQNLPSGQEMFRTAASSRSRPGF